MQPNKDWHKEIENFNMTKLNFTFAAHNFTEDSIKLVLNFSDPLAISPMMEPDLIVLDFNYTDLIRSPSEGFLRE